MIHEAYMAGFVDADGCISIRCSRGGRICGVYLIIVQSERAVLDAIMTRFGGSVNPYKSGFGHGHWRWVIASKNAKRCLTDIIPYLFQKKRQAELALLLQEHLDSVWWRTHHAGRHSRVTEADLQYRVKIWNEVKALNMCHKHRAAATTEPSGPEEGMRQSELVPKDKDER